MLIQTIVLGPYEVVMMIDFHSGTAFCPEYEQFQLVVRDGILPANTENSSC